KRILQEISEEQNNATLLILDDYHSALRLCYDKHLSKENAEEHNIESQKIFQQMQEKLLHNMQEFQVLNDYLKEENSMALMLVPLISSNKTECEKEAQNFADNMRKINTVLAVDEIMKKY
ncbi:MAG: hypothetical protein II131_00925, partial [Neisseriaceae bacterium]|nr:hypothetical protein [Neisseriaceae bacterium]